MRCYMHELFEAHDPGAWHPERPARYAAVAAAVAASGAEIVEAQPASPSDLAGAPAAPGGAEIVEAQPASPSDLARAHPAASLDALQALCAAGGGSIDPDTAVTEVSFEAASRASGAAVAAADAVLDGEVRDAF